MKRKVGLFLLTVLVAVSLGATIVASLAMYRLVSGLQDEELRRLPRREPDQGLPGLHAGLAVHLDHLADPDAHAIRPIDVVVVRGKTRPVVLFEVFDRDPPPVHAEKLKTREPPAAGRRGPAAARHGDGAPSFRGMPRPRAPMIPRPGTC